MSSFVLFSILRNLFYLICQNVKIRRFFYAETHCRPTWEIILPLHGKTAIGGSFAHFEP